MSIMWPPGGEVEDETAPVPERVPGPRTCGCPPETPHADDCPYRAQVAPPADGPTWVGKDEPASLRDMLLSGATYRQLDYWWRTGVFRAADDPDGPVNPGSGKPRVWTGREQQIAALIVRLSTSGMEISMAARMARDSVDRGIYRITTADGVTISWNRVA